MSTLFYFSEPVCPVFMDYKGNRKQNMWEVSAFNLLTTQMHEFSLLSCTKSVLLITP